MRALDVRALLGLGLLVTTLVGCALPVPTCEDPAYFAEAIGPANIAVREDGSFTYDLENYASCHEYCARTYRSWGAPSSCGIREGATGPRGEDGSSSDVWIWCVYDRPLCDHIVIVEPPDFH